MKLKLSFKGQKPNPQVNLPASKSISNRLLIIQALCDHAFQIHNLSEAEDTIILKAALTQNEPKVDLKMAGTAMRFLTAYYALKGEAKVLEGHPRLLERPIGELVRVLTQMGGKVSFLKNNSFPPIKIHSASALKGGFYEIDSSLSSQFLSALLLIAPYLKSNFYLKPKGSAVSHPYLGMTMALMRQMGASVQEKNHLIEVKNIPYTFDGEIEVEKDWSSASFFYQMAAFGIDNILLKGLNQKTIQGDQKLAEVYQLFGVETKYSSEGTWLCRSSKTKKKSIYLNMRDYPDLIPSLIVTAAVFGVETSITGVKTLRIKESNRVEALQKELLKIGKVLTDLDEDIICIQPSDLNTDLKLTFSSHNDHRMVMALAPLVILFKNIKIEGAEMVKKSFPDYWEQLEKIGIQLERS